MFKNVFFNTRTDKIHLWEQINGSNQFTEIDWVPYVYIKSSNGDIKTINNDNVEKKTFSTYRDYFQYNKDNYGIFENNVRPEIQFLAERYHGINDDEIDVPKLLIYHLDIEVNSSVGFPNAIDANDPITLITIYNNLDKEFVSFGIKPYTGDKKIKYNKCDNEKILLTRFLKYVHTNPPDVYSGWNIYGFDIPYIINRSNNIFGQKSGIYNYLSPIRIVRTWKSKKSENINIDIAGITILDYMMLYKWYSPNNLEKYTLNYVANFELGEKKVDYSEYEDLRDLYDKNYDKYVEYNLKDCELVHKLEKKLGYINLVQALSLLTKCTMKYYDAMTQLIEGAMLTHFRRNGLCAPYLTGGIQEYFPAAYVKEPIKGMHDWVIDIDIASSYPSHIIALNMSIETYIGRIIGINENKIISYTKNANFPVFNMVKETGIEKFEGKKLKVFNTIISRGLISVSPCGSIFSTKEPGVISTVERNIYAKRSDVKNKMKEIRELLPESERVNQLYSLQLAIKIILNAMFGILAVPYSRYFNVNIAEAITSCGRHTVLEGEKFTNEYYQQIDKNIPKDMVCYIDTDSLFVRMGDYLKVCDPEWENRLDEEKIKIIRNESKKLEDYINGRIFEEVQLQDYNSQVKDFKINFKQEIIAKTALFVKKKKYTYWCVDVDGSPVDKLEVSGLEIVRSDSSEGIRNRIKHITEMIMKKNDEEDIKEQIQQYKKELETIIPEEIAANIGVNNLTKYIINDKSIKGTPWHVKGVTNYRMLLKELNIMNNYEDIYEGDKTKVIYVKKNPYGVETISFKRWPKEFDDILEVDYKTMIDKFFIKKIGFLLEPMNKMELLIKGSDEKINAFFI